MLLLFRMVGDVKIVNGAFANKEHKETIPGHEQKELVPGHKEEFLCAWSGQ